MNEFDNDITRATIAAPRHCFRLDVRLTEASPDGLDIFWNVHIPEP